MIDNLYFFYGDGDYLVDEGIHALAEELRKNSSAGLAVEELNGEVAADQLAEALSAQSLFAQQRLVVVRDQGLFAQKKFIEEAPQIFAALPSTTTLILVYLGFPDKRTKLMAWLMAEARAKEFRTFAPWQEEEALAFVIRQATKNHKKIGSHAARLIWEVAGPNLRHMASEVNKVATYAGEKDHIEAEDVLAVVSAGEIDVFDFMEELKEKQGSAALISLSRLLKEGEDAVRVLGLLASQFGLLLKIKALQQKGSDAFQISAVLKTKPFFVKKNLEKMHCFSLPELKNILSLVLDAEYKVKSGYTPQLVLEDLVLQICRV